MASLALHPDTETGDRICVWAEAGLLAYKLCNRNFDCEHCPLDAALRGVEPVPIDVGRPERTACVPAVAFPDDRCYTGTHTWLKSVGKGARVRFGIDGYAAALIADPRGVRHPQEPHELREGQTVCALVLEGGALPVGSPLAGRVMTWNDALSDKPSHLVSDPYGSGWLAELESWNAPSRSNLLSSAAARRQAHFDDRRFRRRVAFRMLADSEEAIDGSKDDIGFDLRRLIGVACYVSLLHEFVH